MKNNSLAMLATIAAVAALATLIGYVDPQVCAVSAEEAWMRCENIAAQTLTAFWVFFSIAGLSLIGYLSQLRKRKQAQRS
jgi:uncharacterized membrane protein